MVSSELALEILGSRDADLLSMWSVLAGLASLLRTIFALEMLEE